MAKRGVRLFGPFEVFLIILIILNLMDFLEIISSELDYIKKILSWALLGYLLYKASPTKIFFGKKSEDMDILIIVSYFLLVIKNLILYANVAIQDAGVIHIPLVNQQFSLLAFYKLLIDNASSYEHVAFTVGIIVLAGISVYAAIKTPFKKRSVMGVLHENGEPGKMTALRFTTVILVLLAFFIFVFNMMMEWLAIAVDSTILLAALLFYSVFFIRRRISAMKFLYKVGDIGSEFYEKILDHFRYKKSIMLGIAGILVLHLLTDIGIYLVPYLTGLQDPLYLSSLGAGHQNVWIVFAKDLGAVNSLAGTALTIAFIGNIISYILLFLSPAIIWYQIYHRKSLRLKKNWLIAFFTCIPAAILNPLFGISRLNGLNYVGVNVQTRSLLAGTNPFMTIAVMAVFFVTAYTLMKHRETAKAMEIGWVLVSVVFFGLYIWYYFLDIAQYYQQLVINAIAASSFFIAITVFIFQVLTIIFYAGGFLIFLYEIKKHWSRNTY